MISPTGNERSTKPGRRLAWLFALGAVLVASSYAILQGHDTLTAFAKDPRDTSLRAHGGIKGSHLTVPWPEKRVGKDFRPAITLRIPREYVNEGTTWVDESGNITSVAIAFELPGPTPWQERPWLKGKKGTPEYEEFKRTWLGKLSMDVSPGPRGLASRNWYRKNATTSGLLMRDTDIAGLERYSRKFCYKEESLKDPAKKKFLDEKPADDRSPTNCRLDRRIGVVVSPPEITDDDEGVVFDCLSTGCKAYFAVGNLGVSMGTKHEDIPRWKQIVEPARDLVRSFIVSEQRV